MKKKEINSILVVNHFLTKYKDDDYKSNVLRTYMRLKVDNILKSRNKRESDISKYQLFFLGIPLPLISI